MGRRFPLFKPLAACRPLGLAIGCLIAFGVVLVAIGTVGIFSFTPSDVLQGFNDAVQTWKSPGMPMFVGEQFRVCNATGFCTALRPETPDDEGTPPGRHFDEYSPMIYETPGVPRILGDALPFFCGRASANLQLQLRDSNDTQFAAQPDPMPIFAYRWLDVAAEAACNRRLGLYWTELATNGSTLSFCVEVFVLDSVCVTVNRTALGSWTIAPYIFTAQSGCRPFKHALQGCGVSIGSWGYGTYTLVDGTAISGNRSGSLADPPSTLPSNTSWTANLSTVKVQVRSVYDPNLYVEWATNGSLFVDVASTAGSYAFEGVFVGFLGWAFFLAGTVVGGVSVAAVLTVAIFFPNYRARHLYRPAGAPEKNEAQINSRVQRVGLDPDPDEYEDALFESSSAGDGFLGHEHESEGTDDDTLAYTAATSV